MASSMERVIALRDGRIESDRLTDPEPSGHRVIPVIRFILKNGLA